MNDTIVFPPGSRLRKPRPPVIDQKKPEEDDGIVPWEFEGLGVTIIPGLLTWPKFENLWDKVDGIRQSGLWMVGDAMNAGEAKFGEMVWQVDMTGYAPETIKTAQWVSRAFPLSRRRRLPWSYHRAVSKEALNPREQDELLDLVEDKKRRHERVTSKDLGDMVKAFIAAREQAEAAIARRNTPDLELPEPEPQRPPRPQTDYRGDDDEEDQQSVFDTAPGFTAEAARACIDEVQAVAKETEPDPIEMREVSNRVQALLGKRPMGWNSNVLTSVEAAERIVPGEWRMQIIASYRDAGRRLWEVKAYNRDGRRFVLADGPSLPACLAEIALVAAMSDAGLS